MGRVAAELVHTNRRHGRRRDHGSVDRRRVFVAIPNSKIIGIALLVTADEMCYTR